jgi:Protein of unknown function (DUF3037)
MRYLYSVVRFVPNPTRGECVNLGVVLGSDESGEWSLEIISRKDRARKIDDAGVLPGVVAEIERLAGILDKVTDSANAANPSNQSELPEINEKWLRQLAAESANTLQYSRPQPVLAPSLPEALDKLWPLLIVEHEQAQRQAITKHSIVARVKKLMFDHKLSAEHVSQRGILTTDCSHVGIDFVIHNGKVAQLTQCWSFQVQDKEQLLTDIKSWAWTIRDMRLSGGKVEGIESKVSVDPDAPVAVVYAPPSSKNAPEFKEALSAFNDRQVKAEHVELASADVVATNAAKALGIK